MAFENIFLKNTFNTASRWTILLFGLISIVFGLFGLISPEIVLKLMYLTVIDRSTRHDGDYTVTFFSCLSTASFIIGIYYLLAAWHQWRAFYKYTIFLRLLTFLVLILSANNNDDLSPWLTCAALWQLFEAIIGGVAWLYDGRVKNDGPVKNDNPMKRKNKPIKNH